MRKIIARGFAVEFVSVLALIIAIGIAWLGALAELPTEVVISASIGISVAAYIWALKWEMNKEIRENLAIHNLLESIEDEELYEQGKRAIDECRNELENLSKGILEVDPDRLISTVVNFASKAKRELFLTHVWDEQINQKFVLPGSENRWYQIQRDLVKRGIKLKRVFILNRAETVNAETGMIEENIAAIMKQHASDGINVSIAWIENLDEHSFVSDFIQVDSGSVIAPIHLSGGRGYSTVRVFTRPSDVHRYNAILESLLVESIPYEHLGDLLPA